MITTEGHDMPPELTPLTNEEITAINTRWSQFCLNPSHDNALTSAHDVPDLIAEVDRLRAELDDAKRLADYYHEDRDATAGFWEDSQAEVNRLQDELKAAKASRFENNGVGDVAAHIQAETINDLRLN
jgi:uncharacterized small protein (DUF1192 family)